MPLTLTANMQIHYFYSPLTGQAERARVLQTGKEKAVR